MNYWNGRSSRYLFNLFLMMNGRDLEINIFFLELFFVKWRCRYYYLSLIRMENIFLGFISFLVVNGINNFL